MTKKIEVGPGQLSLFDLMPEVSASPTPEAPAPVKPVENSAEKAETPTEMTETAKPTAEAAKPAKPAKKPVKKREPATNLMKQVAAAVGVTASKNMKKVFTDKEIAQIEEIRAKKMEKKDLTKEQKYLMSKDYRRVKGLAREMEIGNQSRIILFPSNNGGGKWFKAVNFSAMYYAYRLAPQMGRSCQIKSDSERFLRCDYMVSVQNIEDFIAKFSKIETSNYFRTEDGIYVFELKHALDDDEVEALRRTEAVKHERMRGIVKPKAMDPAVYQKIMLLSREVTPKICKLDTRHYETVGRGMVESIHGILATYFCYTDGLLNKVQAAQKLLFYVDHIKSGVALLSELNVWNFDKGAQVGETVAHLRDAIINDFNVSVAKDK